MFRLILVLLIFITTAANIKAIDHYFSHLTIKDGLSQSTVKSIYQDYRGYIWIGTADGLNKYNGYEFTIYRNVPLDNNTLCGNDISVIYEDPADSTLWIGTQSDGLNRYVRKNDTFVRYRNTGPKDSSLPSNEVKAIVREPGGKLWITTRYGGLCSYEAKDDKFVKPPFAADDRLATVNSITFDMQGRMWIGTPHGLFTITPSAPNNFNDCTITTAKEALMQTADINTMMFDRRGYLWIGTNGKGVMRYQPDSEELINYTTTDQGQSLPAKTINCLAQQKNGKIWIGSYEGLFSYSPADNNFTYFANDPADNALINDDVIFSIFEDRSGILWIGTYFGGINKLDPDEFRFSRYSNFNKLFGHNKAANNVKSIYKDNDNTLWVATSKGLVAFSKSYFSDNRVNASPQVFFANTDQHLVTGDSKNNIYLSNASGIFIKRRGSSAFEPFKPHVRGGSAAISNLIHALEDTDRTLWFFTTKGLFRYTPDDATLEQMHPIGELLLENNDYFITATESSDGKLWLGSYYGRLFRYNKNTNQITDVKPENAFSYPQPYNRIFSVCEQLPGTIWFGTNNGLYRYTEATGITKGYMDSDGLPNNVIYGVMTDKRQRIWCTTNLGVSVYDASKNTFTNYTWEDGLQSNEFNQSAYLKTNDGTIYAGGINGFNIIEPERITPNEFVPPVVFTALSVYHERLTPFSHPTITTMQADEVKSMKLTHKQAIITFEFAALNFIHTGKNQYRYKLEGYDEDWINATNGRKATYTNIPHGEYTFMVEGSNNNGIWNQQPSKIKITILPPFWLTWWFKTLMLITIAAAIYAISMVRHQNIRRKSVILKQLVQQKTANLSEKNRQIEEQNTELKRINEEIRERNLNIEEQNSLLNQQNEQIGRQRDSLIQLSTELKEINKAKINFFTNISHEFRTPLTLIIGPLKELADHIDTTSKAELQRKFRIVYGNASKLLALVNQLLEFRKTDNSNLKLNVAKQDLVSHARQIFFLFNAIAEKNRINFSFKSSTPKADICFDAEKMEKIIYNLLSNAFKYTPVNGSIEIGIKVVNSEVNISVSDTGAGIAAEDMDNIFEPFTQISKHQNNNSSTGIGLAIIKKYAELHNGYVSVKSRLGEGSIFTVTIPIVTECEEANNQNNQTPLLLTGESEIMLASFSQYSQMMMKEQRTDNDFNLPKLLIVEDDNDLRAYLKEILSPVCRITDTNSADEAIELAEKTNPDIVLCDVTLTGKSGNDVCSTIKRDQHLNHIPVILLSSLTDSANTISALKAGADAIIPKPFDLQLLIATMENILIQRKRLKEKYFHGIVSDQADIQVNQADQQFLARITEEVEKNMTNSEFDVEALCKAINLSQPQTYRKIKALTNLSINEFIRNIRLKKAAQLLTTGNQSISEVAYEVGFSDPNYFTKCFVKLFGHTPSEFIRLKS